MVTYIRNCVQTGYINCYYVVVGGPSAFEFSLILHLLVSVLVDLK
jgi:hypothetical protein